MPTKSPQRWVFWTLSIILTVLLLIVSLTLVDEYSLDEVQVAVGIVSAAVAVAFAVVAILSVMRIASTPFLSEHWESIALATVLSSIVVVSILGQSPWGAGLGLGLIGAAVVAVRHMISLTSDDES